jgi:hypothetical protein
MCPLKRAFKSEGFIFKTPKESFIFKTPKEAFIFTTPKGAIFIRPPGSFFKTPVFLATCAATVVVVLKQRKENE